MRCARPARWRRCPVDRTSGRNSDATCARADLLSRAAQPPRSTYVLPWATYTDPELAHVGLTPRLAEERGVAIDTFEVRMADVDRSRIAGEREGFLRVYVEHGTDTIVGATMVSLYAGELIYHVATSMHAGVGLSSISASVFPYPTRAEAFKRAADAWSRTRLTPWVTRLFAWLLRRRLT